MSQESKDGQDTPENACPHCGKVLKFNEWNGNLCPHCEGILAEQTRPHVSAGEPSVDLDLEAIKKRRLLFLQQPIVESVSLSVQLISKDLLDAISEVERLRAANDELFQRNVNADELHLADESTIYQLEKKLASRSPETATVKSQIVKLPCVIGDYCRDHGFIHGSEAEELRERIDWILKDVEHDPETAANVIVGALRTMLDEIDARDSLAFVESKTQTPASRSPETDTWSKHLQEESVAAHEALDKANIPTTKQVLNRAGDGKQDITIGLAERVRMLASRSSAQTEAQIPCVWIEDSDGVWATTCGVEWIFSDGSLAQNKTFYCHHCGHPVKPQTYTETLDAEEANE